MLPPSSHQSPKPTYSSLPLPLLPNPPNSFFSLTTSPTQIPANSKDFAASQTSSLDILIAYTHYSISTQRGAILPAVAENILFPFTKPISQGNPSTSEFMSIENLKTYGESLSLLPSRSLALPGLVFICAGRLDFRISACRLILWYLHLLPTSHMLNLHSSPYPITSNRF